MIDAVVVKNGRPEGEVFKNYQYDYFYSTSVLQGVNISDSGTTTTVKINLNAVITGSSLNNTPPNINDTSSTIQNLQSKINTTENMITIIAKTSNENYARYKTDISSVAENNKIELSWIDYETLNSTDLKYLEYIYNIKNINDFYGIITSNASKISDIVGVKSIQEIENILKENNVIN